MQTQPKNQQLFASVVLAGGKSRRMQGSDKCTLKLGGSTLLQKAINLLRTEFEVVLLNSNADNPPNSNNFLLVPDLHPGNGPLEGIASSMEWLLKHRKNCQWLFSIPVDCPFLSNACSQAFIQFLEQNPPQQPGREDILLASSGGQIHYTIGLWPLNLSREIRQFLDGGGRAIKHFSKQHRHSLVEFDQDKINPFFNLNTPADYLHAQAQYEEQKNKP